MIIFSNVIEQDLIKLRKVAEQQKNQRALKIKNRVLKQPHDIKLAESLSPITKKLYTINESTKKLGDEFEESVSKAYLKALPNSSKFSNSMPEMIGSLMNSKTSLKITQKDESGRANILGVPIQISGADIKKINENIYEVTPEIYKSLTSPLYTGKTMTNENDILMMNNIMNDLGYTDEGDRDWIRKTIFTKNFQNYLRKFKTELLKKLQTTLMIYKEKE